MFLGGIFWGLIGGDEDWTTKVFLALIIICGILSFWEFMHLLLLLQ